MKIVTGRTGELHVTSDDDRHLHDGTFGEGKDIVSINCHEISPNITSVGKLFSIENEAYVQLNGQYFLKMGED